MDSCSCGQRQGGSQVEPRVTVKAMYHSNDPSQQLEMGVAFPLNPDLDKLIFNAPVDVRNAVANSARVILWLYRPDEQAPYTLVGVGDTPPSLNPLGLAFPAQPAAPAALDGTVIDNLKIGLEAAPGQVLSLTVGLVAHVNSASDAKVQFAEVQLALLSNQDGTGAYQLIYVHPNSNAGGAGVFTEEQCAQMRASNDRIQRWLAQMFC